MDITMFMEKKSTKYKVSRHYVHGEEEYKVSPNFHSKTAS